MVYFNFLIPSGEHKNRLEVVITYYTLQWSLENRPWVVLIILYCTVIFALCGFNSIQNIFFLIDYFTFTVSTKIPVLSFILLRNEFLDQIKIHGFLLTSIR